MRLFFCFGLAAGCFCNNNFMGGGEKWKTVVLYNFETSYCRRINDDNVRTCPRCRQLDRHFFFFNFKESAATDCSLPESITEMSAGSKFRNFPPRVLHDDMSYCGLENVSIELHENRRRNNTLLKLGVHFKTDKPNMDSVTIKNHDPTIFVIKFESYYFRRAFFFFCWFWNIVIFLFQFFFLTGGQGRVILFFKGGLKIYLRT